MSKKIATPRCNEWKDRIGRWMELFREFNEWFNVKVLAENEDSNWIVWRSPRDKDFQDFFEEEYDFSFNELENERRAILTMCAEMNESGSD